MNTKTPLVFPEFEAGVRSTPRDLQVRFKGFHDAYLCAARIVEAHAAAGTLEAAADTLRRAAAEVRANACRLRAVQARIFATYPTRCKFVRERGAQDALAPAAHHNTPHEALAAFKAGSPTSDAADQLIVALELTGEVDSHGAHVGAVDWSTAVPAVVVEAEGR